MCREDAATIFPAHFLWGDFVYKIYKHTFPNGKCYVGLTRTRLTRRWGNGNGYKTCPLVDRAIKKYGWENVKHNILRECETKEMAEIWERFYIAWFKSNDPKYGYNILRGGDVSTNDATDEMRYKLGNGQRGKHHTEEQKKKISDGVKKAFSRPESNGCIGKKASEETKRKMSEAHKGKTMSTESGLSKPVIQLTMDGDFVARYACARDAYRAGFGHYVVIGKCCKHKAEHSGGYRWVYESEHNAG